MKPTLDLDEAARLLNIHPDSLQAKAHDGEVPGAKIGRGWVFVTEDLVAWLREQVAAQTERRRSPVTREVEQRLAPPQRRTRRRIPPPLPDHQISN